MLTTLQRAKRARLPHRRDQPAARARPASASPTRSTRWTLLGRGTPIADLYLQVRVGGDVALLKGMMKELLEAEDARAAATCSTTRSSREHTSGFDGVRARPAPPRAGTTLEEQSGIAARRRCSDAARDLLRRRQHHRLLGMGLTQHRTASPTSSEIANLLLLRGNIGRRAPGLCPVRGHSNVQGDRTMGIYELPAAAFLDALGAEFGFAPPRAHGLDTRRTHPGDARRPRCRSSSRWAATSPPPRPTPRTPQALRAAR